MALIAKDPRQPYTSLDEQLRIGKVHKGDAIGDVIADNPGYIEFLLDKDLISIAGEVEKAYMAAMKESTGPTDKRGGDWSDGLGDWSFDAIDEY